MSIGEERQAIDNPETLQAKQPWWLVLCWVIGGVGCDWYCAFQWFSGKFPFCSPPVLHRMGLIVVLCATISILGTRIAGHKLREAASLFCIASITLLGNMLMWWTGHR